MNYDLDNLFEQLKPDIPFKKKLKILKKLKFVNRVVLMIL